MTEIKTRTEYQCGICGNWYSNEESARRCMERGPGKIYPIGCIYGDHRPGAFYQNITFAVASNRVGKRAYAHMNTGGSWACRDASKGMNYGDSLGTSQCGGPNLYLNQNQKHLDPTTPHFKRMVKYLRDHLIEITVWDGEKPISYATFMKNFKEKKGKQPDGL